MEKFKAATTAVLKHQILIIVLISVLLRLVYQYEILYKIVINTANIITFFSCAYWLLAIFGKHREHISKHHTALHSLLKAFLIILGGSSFSIVILDFNLPYAVFLFIFAVSYLLTAGAYIHEKKFAL